MTTDDTFEDDANNIFSNDFVVPASWAAQTELYELLNGPRAGSISGVTFDFTHPDLPGADDWYSPTGARPFGVVFPWDRADAGDDEAKAAALVTNGQPGGGGWPITQVYEGDTVSIDRVSRLYRGHGSAPLVDDHDAFEIWAYLKVTRPNGSTEGADADNSILFCARDAMGPQSEHRDVDEPAPDSDYESYLAEFRVTFEKIGMRIARLSKRGSTGSTGEWLGLAAKMHSMAEVEREATEPLISGDKLFADLGMLMDLAASSGYALAKAEGTARLVPLAKRGLKAQRSQQAATREAQRRADPVRALALEEIRLNPKISQTWCARNVAAKMQRDQRSVERLIGNLFEWRELPGGGREKRPRPELLRQSAG